MRVLAWKDTDVEGLTEIFVQPQQPTDPDSGRNRELVLQRKRLVNS
jgi:hypothetical protein